MLTTAPGKRRPGETNRMMIAAKVFIRYFSLPPNAYRLLRLTGMKQRVKFCLDG
jgi:hypothetical protein